MKAPKRQFYEKRRTQKISCDWPETFLGFTIVYSRRELGGCHYGNHASADSGSMPEGSWTQDDAFRLYTEGVKSAV